MADLQIRNQYQSLEHGDVKLCVFPTKSQAKLYKIVLDTFEADIATTLKCISNHAMTDMSSLIRAFYDRTIQTTIREEYGLVGFDENTIWMHLEVVLNHLNMCRTRIAGSSKMTIRVEKIMLPYLIIVARLAPSVFPAASDKFFQLLAKAHEALQKEQL